MSRRNHRIAVVTGASAGIGRATAREFARRGWRVGLVARDAGRLDAARREIEADGGEALPLVADVADPAALESAAARVEHEWGPIEAWVNNAMVSVFAEVDQIAPEDFRRVTEVTYLGAVWGTKAALARMRPRNRGVVVQVGSALAYRSIPLQAAYCGAKSAVRGFTDALRCELLHQGSRVRLTMVQLSAFNTPQFDWSRNLMGRRPRPMGRIFQPEVAARGIYWAATHHRREVWVGFPAVEAILGTRAVPGFLDRLLGRSAYSGQLTAEPDPPGRPDNLYAPVPGAQGAHGRFDAQASARSSELWLATRPWALVGGALGAAALAAALFARRR